MFKFFFLTKISNTFDFFGQQSDKKKYVSLGAFIWNHPGRIFLNYSAKTKLTVDFQILKLFDMGHPLYIDGYKYKK